MNVHVAVMYIPIIYRVVARAIRTYMTVHVTFEEITVLGRLCFCVKYLSSCHVYMYIGTCTYRGASYVYILWSMLLE